MTSSLYTNYDNDKIFNAYLQNNFESVNSTISLNRYAILQKYKDISLNIGLISNQFQTLIHQISDVSYRLLANHLDNLDISLNAIVEAIDISNLVYLNSENYIKVIDEDLFIKSDIIISKNDIEYNRTKIEILEDELHILCKKLKNKRII